MIRRPSSIKTSGDGGSMRKFGLKCALFMILQGLIFFVLMAWYDPGRESNYLAATIDKHDRLSETKGPRLILVGGSNLAFGTDAAELERALGRSVVNMGLAAGLGIEFMLNEVKPALRPGDRVLLSLEYDRFSGGYNPLNIRQILEVRPASVRYLEGHQWNRVLLRGGWAMIGGIGRRALGWQTVPGGDAVELSAYTRSGFNRWGDLVAHHSMPGTFGAGTSAVGRAEHADWVPTGRALDALRSFGELCGRSGVEFIYTCPPQLRDILESNRATVGAILEALEQVPNLRILDRPEEHVYEDQHFFDTGYHLTRTGARLRTAKLIRALEGLDQP
ncbi:MAG: hypothetical protein K9N62_11345 [Verrucomicrobia bacterium]|nr:hypothetical protein [Verrucomicrobiota bacterium]